MFLTLGRQLGEHVIHRTLLGTNLQQLPVASHACFHDLGDRLAGVREIYPVIHATRVLGIHHPGQYL